MSAPTCLILLLACAACSADRVSTPERDGGWPRVRASNSVDAATIAVAYNFAEPRFEALQADPEAEHSLYAVRNPVCTTNRLRQGRAQCGFEMGEVRRKLSGDNDVAAARVKRWRRARADMSYRRVGGAHDWTESWWADGPCRT